MARFLTHMEHTEKGAKLTLTQEQEENCRLVYRRREEHPEHYAFAGLWDPEAEYPDDHVIVPLRSVFKEVSGEYKAGKEFANVVGSSNDKYPSAWIKLLEDKLSPGYDVAICCAVRNTKYVIRNGKEEAVDMTCTSGGKDVVGGHVIMGATEAKAVEEGREVSLLPICRAHNTGSRHGGDYYMRLERPMKAVVLEKYLQQEKIEAALAAEAELAATV